MGEGFGGSVFEMMVYVLIDVRTYEDNEMKAEVDWGMPREGTCLKFPVISGTSTRRIDAALL